MQVGHREQRTQAAAMLSEMAEKGDSAAAQVILDNSQAYLVAMQHAGIFTGLVDPVTPTFTPHSANSCDPEFFLAQTLSCVALPLPKPPSP